VPPTPEASAGTDLRIFVRGAKKAHRCGLLEICIGPGNAAVDKVKNNTR
jgi:hypothetical protein